MGKYGSNLKFDENGVLPFGCYYVTLNEIKSFFVDNFPKSKTRQSRWDCFMNFYDNLLINVKSSTNLLINGSFVTNKLNPNDIDFVIILNNPTLSEKNYIEKRFLFKSGLRKEFDIIKDAVGKGHYNKDVLYDSKFFEYGCDFFPLYRVPPKSSGYNIYTSNKNFWINKWSKDRYNMKKGFLNLFIKHGGDNHEL